MIAKTDMTPGPVFGRRDPDARGYFGEFGGRFVPETLVAPVDELTAAYEEARRDPAFLAALQDLLSTYVGRPTPLYEARRATGASGVRLFLKREDLAHTGAHKINNALGQALLAARMGKRRIVAETGAGQHGVATATACALLGLECVVYMGAEDMARQALNVFRMRLLGATVEQVDAGSRTLKATFACYLAAAGGGMPARWASCARAGHQGSGCHLKTLPVRLATKTTPVEVAVSM